MRETLLWLRNHYDVGDPSLKQQVLARVDAILDDENSAPNLVMPWREITDEMVERGARAHCPFAFEAGSGGAGRAEAIEEVRDILTAALSVTRTLGK